MANNTPAQTNYFVKINSLRHFPSDILAFTTDAKFVYEKLGVIFVVFMENSCNNYYHVTKFYVNKNLIFIYFSS